MEPNKYSKQFLADVVAKSPDLSRFIKKIEQLSKLNQAVKQQLDPTLARQCQVANLRNGMLILTTPSSIWGHQLRFQEMELLSALRATPEWCGLTSIQSRVVPISSTQRVPRLDFPGFSKPHLSDMGARTLKETAHSIASPRLQQALLRLAAHAITGYK